MALFDLQGHRGARGLRPENTLPAFEAAFDCQVTSVETDLHRTLDGQLVLCHDPRLPDGSPVASLKLAQLRLPSPPTTQDEGDTLSRWFTAQHGLALHAIPTLADLFAFATAYAGEPGRAVGKTPVQQRSAAHVLFDLEVKNVPFYPEALGIDLADFAAELVTAVRSANMVERVRVRSFDHRAVLAVRQREPAIPGAILVAEITPVAPGALAAAAGADTYCPHFAFLDKPCIRAAHEANLRVIPWTVNDLAHWRRLIDWRVDGLTTDYPDQLADFLTENGIAFDPASVVY